MRDLNIFLKEGNFDGDVVMQSRSDSSVIAVRATRSTLKKYRELERCGVYMLMFKQRTVYVGQTNEKCNQRPFDLHTDNIEKYWHTALVFSIQNANITDNELKYIENALCEYVHKNNNYECITSVPARNNCNMDFRRSAYSLETPKIFACEKIIEDIKFYIKLFPASIFPPQHVFSNGCSEIPQSNPLSIESSTPVPTASSQPETALFYYQNPRKDVKGYAEIAIHLGSASPNRDVVLKRGAVLGAISTAPSFATTANKIKNKRDELRRNGELVQNVLQADIPINNTNFALELLSGVSLSAPENWKTADGTKLKDLLL